MTDKTDGYDELKVHVDMWKHYDDLRQQKNGNFLTANTILVAVVGFGPQYAGALVWIVPLLGIAVAYAWLQLQVRNSDYIKLHRDKVAEIVGSDWTPESSAPESRKLDRRLPVSFGLFWLVLIVVTALKSIIALVGCLLTWAS